MTPEEIRSWFSIILGASGVLGAAWIAARASIRNRREGNRDAARTPTPPTTLQVWERLDRMETRVGALVGVLHDVARQWPAGASGPVLNEEHLRILEDTLPPQWKRRIT